MNFKFKKDKYKKARGNKSKLLNIYCDSCDAFILTYQKDGPGQLKRLYLDRIFHPKNLTNLDKQPLNKIQNLVCSNCKGPIATPYIYKKENRKAFRLYQSAVNKEVRKLKES